MLFKIESPDSEILPSYLYGTLHLNIHEKQIGKEICLLPKIVKQIFEKARCYVFEADVTQVLNSEEVIERWFQKTEQSNPGWFKAYVEQISKAAFTGGNEGNDTEENKSSIKSMLEKITPIFLLHSLLSKQDPSEKLSAALAPVLDVLFMEQAKFTGRPVHYIETLEDQWKMLLGYDQPLEDHLSACEDGVRFIQNNGEITDDVQFLKESYLNQNLDALVKVRHPFAQIKPEIPALTTYLDNLIKVRDKKMANYQGFAFGNVFMAVGALHLPGVIENLKQKGYIVSQIELGQRCYSINPWKLEIISAEMQNFLKVVELGLPSFFASDQCMKSNLSFLKKAGWTNSIFGEIGIDALQSLLIQPTCSIEQCLYNKAAELRFKPEEILHLAPKIRKKAFECLPSLQIFLEAGLSPANLMVLGIEKLKIWLETPDRHIKLVLAMVGWQEVLAHADPKKLVQTCYAAHYSGINFHEFNLLDKNLQTDCMKNLDGVHTLFKYQMDWNMFKTMNRTLRQAFLTHPEASKTLLKMAEEHHFSVTEVVKDEGITVYLNHPPESFILPKLAQNLVDKICQQRESTTQLVAK